GWPSRPTSPAGLQLWLPVPEGGLRAAGARFCFAYAAARLRDYRRFPHVGPWWGAPIAADAFGVMHYGPRHYFPAARILIDVSFLLIALSFCFRIAPRRRADRASDIAVGLLGGFWPV